MSAGAAEVGGEGRGSRRLGSGLDGWWAVGTKLVAWFAAVVVAAGVVVFGILRLCGACFHGSLETFCGRNGLLSWTRCHWKRSKRMDR